mmetsp:Transcript_26569/g.55169  ORF Transcript_26569/g.55169 Transcript_26569/m.55169 type:complete len:345 (-) Transcript_26569:542-1576(-)
MLHQHDHFALPKPPGSAIGDICASDLAEKVQDLVGWQEAVFHTQGFKFFHDDVTTHRVSRTVHRHGETDVLQDAFHCSPPNAMLQELMNKAFQVPWVYDRVLHIMTFFIFSLPIAYQTFHPMEQAVVVSSISALSGSLHHTDICQKTHQSVGIVLSIQRQALLHLSARDAVLLPPQLVIELLRAAVLPGHVQSKAYLLLHLHWDGGLHERCHQLRDIHLTERVIQMLHQIQIHLIHLLLIQALDADLQGTLGTRLLGMFQRLKLGQVGPVHALGQSFRIDQCFVNVRWGLHVHILHANVDLHQFLLQIGPIFVNVLTAFLTLFVFQAHAEVQIMHLCGILLRQT